MSKKLEEKRQRRLAEERRRHEQRRAVQRRNLITILVAVAVAGLVVVSIIIERGGEERAATGPIGVSAAAARCGEVETHEALPAQHVPEGTPVEYNSNPPSSGPHYETPAGAGFYPQELPAEQVVHNLEHGQVVIWYGPDLDDEAKDQLESYVERENEASAGAEPLVALPWGQLDDGNYGLSAWVRVGEEEDAQEGKTQTCDRVSSAAIDDFRERFQGRAPEQFTPPFEG